MFLALLLLLAAGFPPFGAEHPGTGFSRRCTAPGAAGSGELLFVGGRRLVGEVGVALVGWLALLAGLSLVSGLTFRRVAAGTGRAAQAAKAGMEERSRRRREYEADPDLAVDDLFLEDGGTERRGPAFPPTEPEDEEGWEATTVMAGPAGPRLLDGEEEFPDLFTAVDAEAVARPAPGAGEGDRDRAETLPLAGATSPGGGGAAEAEGSLPGGPGPAPDERPRGALVLEEGLSSTPRLHPAGRRDPEAKRARPGGGAGRPGHGQPADRDPGPFRGRCPHGGHGGGAAGHPLRAPAGSGDQGEQGGRPEGRPGLCPGQHRDPHPGPDPG